MEKEIVSTHHRSSTYLAIEFFFIILSALLLLTTGCDKLKKQTGSKTEKKSEDSVTKESNKTESKEKAEGPCGQYAEKLCELLDPKSSTCNSVKTVAEIMPPAACEAGIKDLEFSKGKLSELRKVCDKLISKLCTDLGPETKTCEMVRSQTAMFTPERCEAMMKQYPAVIADLKKREEANKPLTPDKQQKIVEGAVAVFGPDDAKVTLVEFSDFQCPYCSRAAKATKELKGKYADKIRFVFRQFPLSFHQQAHLAAQAALAAAAQGKFWEYHDLLFENQKALSRSDLEKYATQVKLNMKEFKEALDKQTYKKAVDEDIKIGGEVAVRGTPTLFINGERASNPSDFKSIAKEIDAKL